MNRIAGRSGREAAVKALGFASFEAYLESDVWKWVRGRAIKESGGACAGCGRPATHAHLARHCPEDLTGETLRHVVPVCEACRRFAEADDGRAMVAAGGGGGSAPRTGIYVIPAGTSCLVRRSGGEWAAHRASRELRFRSHTVTDNGGRWLFSDGDWQLKVAPSLVGGRPGKGRTKTGSVDEREREGRRKAWKKRARPH